MLVGSFKPWDATRFGKPWFARIVADGGGICFKFDETAFVGDEGKGGSLEADVADGEFVAFGQKDYLGGKTVVKMGFFSDGEFVDMEQREIRKRLSGR